MFGFFVFISLARVLLPFRHRPQQCPRCFGDRHCVVMVSSTTVPSTASIASAVVVVISTLESSSGDTSRWRLHDLNAEKHAVHPTVHAAVQWKHAGHTRTRTLYPVRSRCFSTFEIPRGNQKACSTFHWLCSSFGLQSRRSVISFK